VDLASEMQPLASNLNVTGFGVKDVTFQSRQRSGLESFNCNLLQQWCLDWCLHTEGTGRQLISFNKVGATHVRFNITSNYGGNRVAINEVQFKAIPEPSASLALLASGLAGVGLRKRA
jgi:hypothetical protein